MFEEIRPYNDKEIPEAIARVAADPMFGTIIHYLFPEEDVETFRLQFLQIKTIRDFQEKVMLRAVSSIVSQTASDFSCDGFEKLNPEKRYLFLANHRDIVLDAAILQVVLNQYHHETSEITFGNNLMQGQLIIDIGKMNKMFRIIRSGSMYDFYRNLQQVSAYMRFALLQKRQSVWIAQRNGRTKDGSDKTEPALLKMLSKSSDKPFADNLNELNITPVIISYEYEPCDFLKAQELYISQYQPYIKDVGEDLHSILRGITQQKGRIHLSVADTLTLEELNECGRMGKNAQFGSLAQLIDQRIYNQYKLFPTNYIGYDLLNETNRFSKCYTADEKLQFEERMNAGLAILSGEQEELRNIFLQIYASPVMNCK